MAAPPGTTFSAPGGSPASSASSANRTAPNGAISGGFATTVLPAASAGAAFWPMPIIGPFHGGITATTPYGSCSTRSRWSAAYTGTTSPVSLSIHPA